MEHVLVVISRPLMVHVLQIPAAVYENDRRAALLIMGGLVHTRRDLDAIARGNHHDGWILPGVLRELGGGRSGEAAEILPRTVLLYVEIGRFVGVGVDIGNPMLVRREDGGVLTGGLGDAGERTSVPRHFVEELVGGAIGVGNQVELGFVPGLAHVEHLPMAAGEDTRFAGFKWHGVELGIAGLLADEVDFAIVLHPAEGVGGALRAADPGVVVDIDQRAGLTGGRIEGEDPAIFVVAGAGADDGPGSVLAPNGNAHLDVAVRGAPGLLLAVIHPPDFAGLHVEDGEAGRALGIADIGAAGDVFGVGAVGDEVGDDGALGGRGGRFEDARDHVLFVGREPHGADGLARL